MKEKQKQDVLSDCKISLSSHLQKHLEFSLTNKWKQVPNTFLKYVQSGFCSFQQGK
jgi:hypothetical protein